MKQYLSVIDEKGRSLKNVELIPIVVDTLPQSGERLGALYFNKADNLLYVWTGTTFKSAGGITKLSELTIDVDKDWGGYVIKNLGAPVDATDAARKQEVDAVQNNLDTHENKVLEGIHGVIADAESNMPSAGVAGRLFIATDTLKIFRDNGTSWDELTAVGRLNDHASQTGGTHGVPSDASFEHTGNKGAANGYCPLDANALVPLDNLPAIPPDKVDAVDTPADGEVLSYNATEGKFEWVPQAAAGGFNVVSVTADYTASDRDCVLADASGGAITVTLPSPSANAEVIVKKIDSSTNTVTVAPSGTETIDGASQQVLDTQYEAIHVISDGTDWYIV